ncbi:hypothetical protein MHU86_11819 [Fragilaria crotonensis]|nr:hypothetical protein MHU86_11819 [Fragilaria crotonensis]
MATPSVAKRRFVTVVFMTVVSVLFLINAQYGIHEDEVVTSVTQNSFGSTVQVVDDATEQEWNPNSRHSESSSNLSHLMMPINDINSTEYIVFDNACIYPDHSPQTWTLRVLNRRVITTNDGESASEERDHDPFINMTAFVGEGSFARHTIRVVQDHKLDTTSVHDQWREGTHLLISHHTPDNNFHLLNDLLLPVYRAFIKTRINGVVFFQGCDGCWKKRLPTMSIMLSMMNLTVTHPLEKVVSINTPICFDRLIIRGYAEFPFYSREGRFSRYWPQEIFRGYRDSAHAYFQTLLPSHDTKGQLVTTTRRSSEVKINADSDSVASRNASPPVLSWISRWSARKCKRRCITNEKNVVKELSKYFHVHLLDFDAGLTAEQAMAYIMDTDVLVGLHGAGLGYISYLPDRAMVVELKSALHNDKTMFLNMASSVDLPYYAVTLGCFDRSSRDVYTLPSDTIRSLVTEIGAAYQQEKIKFARGLSPTTGQCLFPLYIHPCGHLSSVNNSRCYLQKPRRNAPWMQCVHYNDCK